MLDNIKIAVVDMGSNSFRLQISETISGTYKVVVDYKEVLRIGDGVYKSGVFSPEAMENVLGTLKRMRIIMDNNNVTAWRLVGTAPFREAANAAELLETVKRELDLDIDIITGEEEAQLVYLAATSYVNLSDMNALFVDVGGGSTEFSYSIKGELAKSASTPLGCSKLTYQFVQKNKAKPDEIKKMKKYITGVLDGVAEDYKIDRVLFTGGTVNNLAQVYIRRSSLQDSAMKYVDGIFFKHLLNELAGKSYEDRAKIPGLEPERADISLAAALIVRSLLKRYDLEGFYTFAGGLRAGLTIDLLNKLGVELLFQQNEQADLRYTKLLETGRKYNYEEEHALHVTRLARKLFDSLKDELKLANEDWLLLEAASILHDIGQHISYEDHHKHSYYMIKNTELADYTTAQKLVIANIARYHRHSVPKLKHTWFSELAAENRRKTIALAGILRVADGLDRSHTAAVEDISVESSNKVIYIKIFSSKYVDMEIAGADKKKGLLESAAKKKIIVSQ